MGQRLGVASALLGNPFSGNFGIVSPLSPWTGFAVMCTYALVLIGFAAWRLRRVDA